MESNMKHDQYSPISCSSEEQVERLSEEEQPFMERSGLDKRTIHIRQHVKCAFLVLPWVLSAILATLLLHQWKSEAMYSGVPPSVVQYRPKRFVSGFGQDSSPYQGWPSAEIDALWDSLYYNVQNLHIDKALYSSFTTTSEHANVEGLEDQYIIGLSVFHELHCLDAIRKMLYPKHYNTSIVNQDGSVDYFAWMHMDHCIEVLRQGITCRADTSVIPLKWSDSAKVLDPQVGSMHMCRDFNRILDWATEHPIKLDKRKHVENGVVKDYSAVEIPPSHYAELQPVPGWHYTVQDL